MSKKWRVDEGKTDSTVMLGWSLLAAYITAYDVFALITKRKTLSTEYREASRRHPIVVSAVTTYLLVHLYGALPRNYDPLRALVGMANNV